MRIFLLAALIAFCAVAAEAGPNRGRLVRIHKVTREQYNELLKLANDEEEVPEGRLLSSPLTGIKDLAESVKSLPSFFSSSSKTKNSYPLCVISPDHKEESQRFFTNGGSSTKHRYGSWIVSGNDDDHDDGGLVEGGHNGGPLADGEGEETETDDTHKPTVVNCILVLKGDDGNVIQPRPPTNPNPNPNPHHHPYPYPHPYPHPYPYPHTPSHPHTHPETPYYPPYYQYPWYSGWPYGHYGPHYPHTAPHTPHCDPHTDPKCHKSD